MHSKTNRRQQCRPQRHMHGLFPCGGQTVTSNPILMPLQLLISTAHYPPTRTVTFADVADDEAATDLIGSCCIRREPLFSSIRSSILRMRVMYVENCEWLRVSDTSRGASCGMTFVAVNLAPQWLEIASQTPKTHINVPGVRSTAVTWTQQDVHPERTSVFTIVSTGGFGAEYRLLECLVQGNSNGSTILWAIPSNQIVLKNIHISHTLPRLHQRKLMPFIPLDLPKRHANMKD